MPKLLAASFLVMLSMIAVLFTVPPAQAGKCSDSPVMARGEDSPFVWLAKTKARANWRRKVRSIPGLGPDYANWSRAENTEERCLTGPAGALCIFTGTPCLP